MRCWLLYPHNRCGLLPEEVTVICNAEQMLSSCNEPCYSHRNFALCSLTILVSFSYSCGVLAPFQHWKLRGCLMDSLSGFSDTRKKFRKEGFASMGYFTGAVGAQGCRQCIVIVKMLEECTSIVAFHTALRRLCSFCRKVCVI